MSTKRNFSTIALLSGGTAALAMLTGLAGARADDLKVNQQLLSERLDQLAAVGLQPGAGAYLGVEQNKAAGAPVNAISGGTPFPDEHTGWGYAADSRSLSAGEVQQVAAFLDATPYEVLAVHLPSAADAEPPLYPENRDWNTPEDAAWLGSHYPRLVAFFHAAATAGECTVFWAA